MGCMLVIDDFGMGYLLLSYFKLLFVDYIKIDCLFVVNIVSSVDDRNIVYFMIFMVCNMGM